MTNCAEGGPNVGFVIRAADGFVIRAADVGLACADGSWRPGRYTFVTNPRHHSSGLRAIASLSFRITDPVLGPARTCVVACV